MVYYSVLGPLTVRANNGAEVAIGGARLRRLLVQLLLDPGRTVGTARLMDGIWSDGAPAGASNALQALVSRLRRILGDSDPLHGDIMGYRLDVSRSRVDLCEFEDLVAAGRGLRAQDDPRGAAQRFGDALALWRGPPLTDLTETGVANEVAVRLVELRRNVIEERLACLLDVGDHHVALPDIEAMVASEPLRERPVDLLIRALDACGRQADALTAYEQLRDRLADELGIDPSTQMQELHLRLLRGELRPASPDESPNVSARPVIRLPQALTSFIARDEELSTAVRMVSGQRLVTMIGPGGAGKTRLAIETGAALAERDPSLVVDGAWFVDLARIGTGTEIAHTVLSVLGLRERSLMVMQTGAPIPAASPLDRLIETLGSQSLLLILDNCEHLVTDAAGFVERLLTACPKLRILATSREPLAVSGERLLAVPSLGLPPENVPAEEVAGYPAVRLFAERVAAFSPGFTVDAGNAEYVARICRELDGMPLALELAAARVRAMPLAQLGSRLSDRFRLLTNGGRSVLPRHQTLHAVVDWSWELLDDAERALMRRFSVFIGGASLDAVERVCGDDGGPRINGHDIWSVLFALVDKSLVVAEPLQDEASTAPRYRMLETIRAYGAQRLTESGEEQELRRAHAGHMLELWNEGDPKLRTSEQLPWMSRLRADHDNLLAAQRWAVDTGQVELALDLYQAAAWYHQMSDCGPDLRRRYNELRNLVGAEPPEGRVVSYVQCLMMTAAFGEEEGGGAPHGEIERIGETLNRAGILPEQHETLIFLLVYQGMLGQDRASTLRRLERAAADSGPWLSAMARVLAGVVAMQAGMGARAHDLLARGLEAYRAVGDRWGIIQAITLIVDVVRLSDPDQELVLLDEGIGLAREIGFTSLDAILRFRRVLAQVAGGRADAARDELARVDTNGIEPSVLIMLKLTEAEVERRTGSTMRARTILRDLQRQIGVMGSILRGYVEPICHMMLARVADDGVGKWWHVAAAWDSVAPDLDAMQTGLVVEMLAELVHGEEPEYAATLLGYAEAARGLPNEAEPDIVRARDAVRAHIGEERYAAAYQRGTTTLPESVVAEVREWVRARTPEEASVPGPETQERRR